MRSIATHLEKGILKPVPVSFHESHSLRFGSPELLLSPGKPDTVRNTNRPESAGMALKWGGVFSIVVQVALQTLMELLADIETLFRYCFPHLPVVNKLLRFWPSQAD